MVDWYMKGQSDYLSTDFHMGFWFDVDGFPEANYDSISMPNDVATGDPFMAVGAKTKPTWNPGEQAFELGLWDHNRIKVGTGGIWGWHNTSGLWLSLFGGGGGGPTPDHNDLGGLNAGDDYEHITQTQKDALHSIYTLEQHDNNYHSTNYEVANTNIQSHVATPVTDAHHAATVAGDLSHNDLADKNAGDDWEHITQNQKDALHSIYTLEVHAMDSATFHSRTDIATLNASTSYHGFLKKLDNVSTNFMNGQGNWAVPAGGGGDPTYIYTDLGGFNGFIEVFFYGRMQEVLFSDANASVTGNCFVENGGSFKIMIIHFSDTNNTGKTAAGILALTHAIEGGTHDLDGQDAFDLPLTGALELNYDIYGTPYTIPDNSSVGLYWQKFDDAESASGNMYVFSIVLVRQ